MKDRLCVALALVLLGAVGWVCWVKRGAPPHLEESPAKPRIARTVTAPTTRGSTAEAPKTAVPASATAKLDWAAITNFNEWSTQWTVASVEEREALKAEGIRLAEARRPEFKKLIEADPERALEQAIRHVIRQQLPDEIVALLEKPVSARGDFKVYFGRPAPDVELEGSQLVRRYFETAAGESYVAHVFGDVEALMTRKDVPLRGVAVDRELAVADSAVRQLDVGERIPASAIVEETCPVSGKSSRVEVPSDEPISDDTPAIELEGRIIRLCDGSHVRVLEQQNRLTSNIAASGGPGGAQPIRDAFPGTSSEAIGNFRALYIRACYPDRLNAPNTEDSAYTDMKNFSRFYMESSYGRLSVSTVVTPLIVLPHTREWYEAKDAEVDGLGLVHSHSRSEARRIGFDSGQFNVTIVRINGGPRLNGISWGGGDSVWLSWDGMDVINHECGHSIGRPHANFWNTTNLSAIGPGANQEYGNSFDVMGGGGGFSAHYNTISKRALGWLPTQNTHNPTASGVYRVFAYDQPVLEEGKRYGLRVPKDITRGYNLEFHRAYGVEHTGQRELTNSALVIWSGFGGAGHLIDTTPRSPGGKDDGGIELGRTFSDSAAAVHFTVVSRNETAPPSLDIAVTMGNTETNLPPTLSLSASATTVAINGTLTFTATASDPNGDPLSYHWDCGDGTTSENTPVFTRSFTAARLLTIHCTVSDMKGGTARRHVVVNVGNSTRRTLIGRITVGGQPLQDVLVLGGGRSAYTDSNGEYALSDLATGAQVINTALYGYSFTPTDPSVTIGTGANVQDFTATAMPQISIIPLSDATENGSSGAFSLARTGDTSAALNVHVMSASGTASRTVDYNFVPAYVDDGNYRIFTIPAGSSSLEISVVPINDGASEGPETVKLQLAEGVGYIPAAAGIATLTIADDDTTLPQISIRADDREASEGTGEVLAFVLTRSGSTADNVEVALGYGGTATRGVDYPNLPSSITIPAGETSATVMLGPLDDTLVEGSETVTVMLTSGAGYVLDTSSTTVDFLILDDDIPTLTVTALDPTASEAGRDPGVFLITRTGPTTAPLRVFYGISGDALHGTDYVQLPAEVTIPAGAASAPVFITPYDDAHGEGIETVTIQLTVFDGSYLVGSPMTASVTISDNDDVGLVSVDAFSSTTGEPGDNGRFRFHLNGSRTTPTTVRYTVSGTATSGVDYQALPGTVVLPAPVNGDSEVDVDVFIINDTLKEDVETITVTLTPDPAYVVYASGSATALLRDDDQPIVSLTKANAAPAEGGASSSFYIGRSTASFGAITNGDLTVNYTVSGTAQNGVDYTLLSGTAIISSGTAGVDIPLVPLEDSLFDGTETVTLTLAPSPNYGIGEREATLYLADNESHTISVRFPVTAATTTEAPHPTDGEYRLVSVILSAAAADTVTAECVAAAGTTAWADGIDWTLVNETNGPIQVALLTFPPGVTTQNLKLRIIPDNVIEGNEDIVLSLRNPRNARLSTTQGSYTLTINDNTSAHSPARFTFLVNSSSVSEGQPQPPLLMVGLDRRLQTTARVNYAVTGGTATSGSDYTLAAGALTFAAGETAKLIPLTVINDLDSESPETVLVSLSSPVGAQLGPITNHTLTILDNDDDTPSVSIAATDSSATEGGDSASFTVTRLSGGAAADLTVKYLVSGNAAAGSDYVALPGQVTISAGQASAVIILNTLDDAELESAETVTLTIIPDAAYALGPTVTATANIRDDETQGLPPTAFAQNLYVPRNQPSAITLSGSDPNGDPITYQIVTTPTRGALSGTTPNVTYTPTLNYTGPDSFTFRVTDGATTSAVATISLTVFNPILVASNSTWRYNDAGVDLGTGWRTNGYNEAGWGTGAARLGFGDAQATVLRGQPVITYYFRQTFTPPTGITWTTISGRVQRDDGVVVYVNGFSVFTDNMPSDPTYTTRPNSRVDGTAETDWFSFSVNPSLIHSGANLIAAEVHQFDGNSSDLGFALELTGAGVPAAAGVATVIISATDAAATEPNDPAAFTVTRFSQDMSRDLAVNYSISGSAMPGTDYAWPSSVVTIPAGQASATIPITPLNDYNIEPLKTVIVTLAPGIGYKLETNVTDTVTLADDDAGREPPTANAQSVSVPINTPTWINLTGSDLQDDPLTYQVVGRPIYGTLSGTPPNLTYTPNPDYAGPDSFTFRVHDGGIWSAFALVSITVYDPALMIAPQSTWRYNDRGVDLGTAWRTNTYNDSTWSNGLARLGFGADGENTTLRGQPVITYYFRRTFVVPSGYIISSATLRLQRDDGAVVYLNGIEVASDNMPDETIVYGTRPNTGITGTGETTWYEFPVSPARVRWGTNVMAAEVHQIDSGSSDAGFDLEFRAEGYFGAVPAPRLSIDLVPPDQVRLRFLSVEGARFAVDASADLQTWQPFGTNTVSGGVFQYLVPSANPDARFFRARQVP
jgi:Calx-beta domain-containing protein/Big-like domain-containing protein/PKD domain-containing protein